MNDIIATEDALGLNIVCVTDARSTTANSNALKAKKPKKRNKYEKRRAKAQRAKQLKEKGHNGSVHNKPPVNSLNTTAEAKKCVVESRQDDSDKQDKNIAGGKEETENDEPKMEIYRSNSSRVSQNVENGVSAEALKFFDSETSRKKQHSRTEQLLKDETRRAEYMSTYHARPYEMDRKSGAVSKISESKESTHIFEMDDDDYMSDSENNSQNPFAKCGLHPKIVRAITSEKGMHLQRPTVIQRNSWDQILMRKGRNDNKKVASRNLFVQSETGSGKTLAYLLPIIQVRCK